LTEVASDPVSQENQQPKCLRIVVTAFFTDGSSILIDIPEPKEVKDESRWIEPADFDSVIAQSTYEYVLRVKASDKIPMRSMHLPIRIPGDPW